MARACLFCGSTDSLSREHVWPRWLHTYLTDIGETGNSERWSRVGGRQSWQQPFLSEAVRAFCRTCNNGWMADIEGAAAPIIGPMVTGSARTLDVAAQRMVASWLVLKSMVAVQTSPEQPSIPAHHYAAFTATHRPPRKTAHVWLGARGDLATNSSYPGRVIFFDHHFMPLENVYRGFPAPDLNLHAYLSAGGVLYGTSIQIGHFFALSIHHDWPGTEIRPQPDNERVFCQIWPPTTVTSWPPARTIDRLGDAHHLTRHFMIKTSNTERPA